MAKTNLPRTPAGSSGSSSSSDSSSSDSSSSSSLPPCKSAPVADIVDKACNDVHITESRAPDSPPRPSSVGQAPKIDKVYQRRPKKGTAKKSIPVSKGDAREGGTSGQKPASRIDTGTSKRSTGADARSDGRWKGGRGFQLGKRKRVLDPYEAEEEDHFLFHDIRNKRMAEFKEIVENLTRRQRKAVEQIGFGGLLHFDVDEISADMNSWLVGCLDPVKKYFHWNGDIRFSLTVCDAKKVFGLNANPERSVIANPRHEEARRVLRRWKTRYCLHSTENISVGRVKEFITREGRGGEDFKRLFVLAAMTLLLTPVFDCNVDLGLLSFLWDVEEIQTFNWAGYVVDHLCHSIYMNQLEDSKNGDRLSKGSEGCVMLLQWTYFHNTIWPESPLSNDEPYLRHWGGHKIGFRVWEEMRSKGFGYLMFTDKICVGAELIDAVPAAVPAVKLPPRIEEWDEKDRVEGLDEDDMQEALRNDPHRRIWHILRDVDKLLSGYATCLDMRTPSLKQGCFKIHADAVVTFDPRPGFNIVEKKLLQVCTEVVPSIAKVRNSMYDEPNPVIEPLDAEHPEQELRNSPWCTWTFNYPPTYDSGLIQEICTFSHNFKQHELEIADYCLSGGMASEVLYKNDDDALLYRVEMWTIAPHRSVNPSTLNAYGKVLNSYWSRRGWVTRICLETVIVVDIEKVDPLQVDENWQMWMGASDLRILGAAFVHIPVMYNGDYSLVVVNFVDDIVQMIEPRRPTEDMTDFPILGRKIGECFWQLLEAKKHSNFLTRFREFTYKHIIPTWTESVLYTDRGICVMYMMEHFTGSTYVLDGMRLDSEHKRMQLRLAYLCFIVMDESNKNRRALYDRIPCFLARKKEPAAA